MNVYTMHALMFLHRPSVSWPKQNWNGMDEDEREREKQKFSAQYFDGKFFTRLQNQYKSQFMQMFSKMLCYAI